MSKQTRRRYSDEFKVDAVKLITKQGSLKPFHKHIVTIKFDLAS